MIEQQVADLRRFPEASEQSRLRRYRDIVPTPPYQRWIAQPQGSVFDVAREFRLARETLRDVAQGFKQYYDFMGHYNAYLSGLATEEEFEQASQRFAVADSGDDAILVTRVRCLLRETGLLFHGDELAGLFRVPEDQIERVLDMLARTGELASSQ